VKRFVANRAGDALAASGSVFAEEEDPELARASVPFGLKTIEGLLAQSPHHKGLLLGACSGFTQYAYAFVQQDADLIEAQDLGRATELRGRAKNLYLRARNYGLRGLEEASPGFEARLRKDCDGALATLDRGQVPLLYYTAAAWAGAFALDVADSSLSVDQTLIEKMMQRALALDEAWDQGAIHEFLGAWEAGHGSVGGSLEKAHRHFERAQELCGGQRVSVFVGLAESVSVSAQDRPEFERCLKKALALDLSTAPSRRLANVLAQRRARWLLGRADDLFVDAPKAEEKSS
jgi:predicted anti-sigma-YlaC factor YlaD